MGHGMLCRKCPSDRRERCRLFLDGVTRQRLWPAQAKARPQLLRRRQSFRRLPVIGRSDPARKTSRRKFTQRITAGYAQLLSFLCHSAATAGGRESRWVRNVTALEIFSSEISLPDASLPNSPSHVCALGHWALVLYLMNVF